MLWRRLANQSAQQDLALMLDRHQQLDHTPQLAVFGTRLGLSAIEAAGGVEHHTAHEICVELIRRTMPSHNGYAARDLLAHNECTSLLTERQEQDLVELMDSCGLGKRSIPPRLRADLSSALTTSEAVLIRTFTESPSPPTFRARQPQQKQRPEQDDGGNWTLCWGARGIHSRLARPNTTR